MPDTGSPGPRALAWGNEATREILYAIAEDVRTRAAFKVCAIEVARADGMLEFVAIAGVREGEQQLLGQASPLAAMYPALALGADYGDFTFVAAEWMPAESLQFISEHGFVPDLPPPASPDAWHAQDMLAARLIDDRGRVRGILYLDEPLSGLRPTPMEFLELSDRLSLQLRAVLTAFEREELSNRARVAEAAAEALRGLSIRAGLTGFLADARPHLVQGLRAEELEIRLFGHQRDDDATLAPGFRTELDDLARRAWERRTVVIIEPQAVWGDPGLGVQARLQLSSYVATRGALALVCVPLATADEPVGYLLVLRTDMRWTEVESIAAQALGEDVGRAIQLAQAFEREQRLVSELQRVDARRTEFARTVSHELKNPLTVVVAHLELLQDSELSAQQQYSVEAIERAVFRLQGLLGDLAMISREVRENELWGPVDIGRLVEESAENHRAVAMVSGIELDSKIVGTGLLVTGSTEELRSVVNNLLSNAVKYSDPGGRVTLEVQHVGNEVVVTCADEGIGISPDNQRRLFNDFFRSTNPEALRRPGTGLGLSIVRRVVEHHGGRVEVQSELGRGSVFTIHLPSA
ncbi:MAG: HAMP domain-containing histidine kinase [Nocardioides sp.]|nr:HAMP domain-containing histidine kinase [Nocardioides sp.]